MSAPGLSLYVEYEGQRRQIKLSNPNSTLIQQVLEEACSLFETDPQRHSLKQRKATTPLNNSDPVRFCGLPNNATLELVRRGSTARSGGAAASANRGNTLADAAII